MKWKHGIRNMGLRTYILARLGHWEEEHAFRTCPSGERWCPHLHWRPGKNKNSGSR